MSQRKDPHEILYTFTDFKLSILLSGVENRNHSHDADDSDNDGEQGKLILYPLLFFISRHSFSNL